MKLTLHLTLLAAGLAAFPTANRSAVPAFERWPQFRGPNGSGVAPDDLPGPVRFGPEEMVIWRTPLPPGHSSPCIWGDRIFLTAFIAERESLETFCLDRKSGEILWRKTAPHVALDPALHRYNSPAASTPATDGERVYVYFGSFGVLAYDFAGRELWQRLLPVPPTRQGTASSPIVHRGVLWLQRDGESADSHLLALDPSTGETRWMIPRPLNRESYSTPMIWEHDGEELLITAGAGRVDAYDVRDGTGRWWMAGLTFQPIGMAVAGNGLLFASASGTGTQQEPIPLPGWQELLERFDRDGDGRLSEAEVPEDAVVQLRAEVPRETAGNLLSYRLIFFGMFDADRDGYFTKEEWEELQAFLRNNRDNVMAIRPGGQGNISGTHLEWRGVIGISEMPSPLLYRGRLYFVRNGGMLTSYDPRDGTVVIDRERLGALGQYVASPVAGGGHIYAASHPGRVAVIRAGGGLEVLAVNDLGEEINSTPALLDGRIYVRTEKHLYAFGEEAVQEERRESGTAVPDQRAAVIRVEETEALIERLRHALNTRDLEAFLACFAPDYESEQPVHPDRAFRGVDQVRKNWSMILNEIPDFRAELLRSAFDGETAWGEWRWFGTRRDGSRFDLRGMIIFGIQKDQIKWGRLYMEPVQASGAGIDASVKGMTEAQAAPGEPSEQLEAMEWMVGDWIAETESPEGRAVTTTPSIQWLHGKRFLRAQEETRIGDQVMLFREITWYWDPMGQEVRVSGFFSNGTRIRGMVEVGSGTIRINAEGFDGNGKAMSATHRFTRTGEESMTSQLVNLVIDGEQRPDAPVVEFRRQP
jgi:outer membrane protein assembly factor BamB